MKNYQAKFLGKKWNIFQKEITGLTTRIKQLNTVKKDTDLTESESREIELEIHDLKEIRKSLIPVCIYYKKRYKNSLNNNKVD